MTEFAKTVSFGSMATITVTRNGEVIKKLENCGNTVLDSWFKKWANTQCHPNLWSAGYLRLGDGVGETTLDMPGLINPIPLVGGSNTGFSGGSTVGLTLTDVTENGKNYRDYKTSQRFLYSVGGWVGTLRELGRDVGPSGAITANLVDTRIILPEDVVVTSEDQLMIDYTWCVRVLFEITTHTLTAKYNKVPTEVTVSHCPGQYFQHLIYLLCSLDYGNSPTNYAHYATGLGNPGGNFVGRVSVQVNPSVTRKFDAVSRTDETTFSFATNTFNLSGGLIKLFAFSNDTSQFYSKWQVEPPIPKTDRHALKITLVTKVDRL